MKRLSLGVLAVGALMAMAELAQGATVGHMLKSTTPVAGTDQDVTGSTKKPAATRGVASSTRKRSAKDGDSGVTGSIKPKANTSR